MDPVQDAGALEQQIKNMLSQDKIANMASKAAQSIISDRTKGDPLPYSWWDWW